MGQDVWYFIAGVYSQSGGYIRTYVNGMLDRQLATTAVLGGSTGPFRIGCEPYSAGQCNFNGTMDEICVYNRALSEAEIKALYAPSPKRENEACFQFTQLLSQDEWFYQEPGPTGGARVYWLSVAAVYEPGQAAPQNPWGWQTRPHVFNGGAVHIQPVASWPPAVGADWVSGEPIVFEDISWDMAFDLTTNQIGWVPADLNGDGIVDFKDLAIMAQQWLLGGL
jgi:hypothetical protein